MVSNQFNKEEIRKQIKARNDKAKQKFKQGMVRLWGEDIYKAKR